LLAALFVAQQKTPTLAAPARFVAVTIDDLPLQMHYDLATARALTTKLLQTLTAHRIPAIGFVNEGKLHVNNDSELEARTGLLRRWLDAGLDLGNHTYSHLRYYNAPLERMQDEKVIGRTWQNDALLPPSDAQHRQRPGGQRGV
jgi:peptidoglycan/xylan/chitin deacetylase (PgdA/CDA1 family)